MARSWRTRLVFVAVVAAAVAVGVWWINQGDPIPDHRPASAPKVGSCWTVSPQTARRALPWPGRPVDCAGPHTAEVYHVGQVDRDLVQRARAASGDDRTVAVNLMYAQARRACGAFGSAYLGGDWHATRLALIASWVQPSTNGFFGCAVAQAGHPGGEGFGPRPARLRRTARPLSAVLLPRQ